MHGRRGTRVAVTVAARVAAVVVVASIAVACVEEPPVATGPVAEPVAAVTSLVPGPTLNRSIDRDLVAACVDLVQFRAYVQDPRLSPAWAALAGDVDGLARTCESLGSDDPAALVEMADDWAAVKRWLEAAADSTTTTTVP